MHRDISADQQIQSVIAHLRVNTYTRPGLQKKVMDEVRKQDTHKQPKTRTKRREFRNMIFAVATSGTAAMLLTGMLAASTPRSESSMMLMPVPALEPVIIRTATYEEHEESSKPKVSKPASSSYSKPGAGIKIPSSPVVNVPLEQIREETPELTGINARFCTQRLIDSIADVITLRNDLKDAAHVKTQTPNIPRGVSYPVRIPIHPTPVKAAGM